MASSKGALRNGDQLGAFVIKRRLGKGRHSETYLAHNRSLQRMVALKVIPKGALHSQHVSEARMMASLDHDNIVRVHQIGQKDSLHYVALELMTGGSVRDLVEQTGAMPPIRAARYAMALAKGLQLAHDIGIVHRGLHPRSLLVSHTGTLKIADFGSAVQGKLSGSCRTVYCAPEAWSNQATSKSDTYSVGACLYYMLVGKEPTHSPVEMPAAVPSCLAALTKESMSTDPRARAHSPKQLAKKLEQCVVQLSRSKQHDAVVPLLLPAQEQRELARRSALSSKPLASPIQEPRVLNAVVSNKGNWSEGSEKWSKKYPAKPGSVGIAVMRHLLQVFRFRKGPAALGLMERELEQIGETPGSVKAEGFADLIAALARHIENPAARASFVMQALGDAPPRDSNI